MAGQSPEPSYQPAGQDQGLTQGRPAWQQPPAYTPPGGGQAYAAAAPPYAQQDQGYPAQDQTYTSLGQSPNQDYQDYQDYQGYQQGYQGYDGRQGQAQGASTPPPQWQAVAGMKQAPGRTKARGDKGLVGSLFDFSFSSMVTPKIIKALYILFTIWTVLAAIGILVFFAKTGGLQGTLAAIIIVDPIFILLSLGVYRIILEAFMVIFQIHGELKTIRVQGENRS